MEKVKSRARKGVLTVCALAYSKLNSNPMLTDKQLEAFRNCKGLIEERIKGNDTKVGGGQHRSRDRAGLFFVNAFKTNGDESPVCFVVCAVSLSISRLSLSTEDEREQIFKWLGTVEAQASSKFKEFARSLCEEHHISETVKLSCSQAKRIPDRPIQISEEPGIAGVLSRIGLSWDDLPWDKAFLLQLPNMRTTDTESGDGTYGPHPKIFRLEYGGDKKAAAPTFENAIVHCLSVLNRLHTSRNKTKKRTADDDAHLDFDEAFGQGWEGVQQVRVTKEKINQWLYNLHDEKSDKADNDLRLLNIHGSTLLPREYRLKNQSTTAKFIQDTYGMSDPVLKYTTGNITPIRSITETHHDDLPSVSTARARKNRDHSVVKLWLIWPPEHTYLQGEQYNDTAHTIRSLPGGKFLIQEDGETVFMPVNWLHAVVTIQSCYLYSTSWSLPNIMWAPITIRLQVAGNIPEKEATECRLAWLEKALIQDCEGARRKAATEFTRTWVSEGVYFEKAVEASRLLNLLVGHSKRTGECFICLAMNLSPPEGFKNDSIGHIRGHLLPEIPLPDSSGPKPSHRHEPRTPPPTAAGRATRKRKAADD